MTIAPKAVGLPSFAGGDSRRAVPADGRRRRLWPHRRAMRTWSRRSAALISRHRDATARSASLSARRQPRADREVRLSQELPSSARLRLRARRRRARDRRGGRPLHRGRGLDRRPRCRAISCWRRPPAIPSIRIAAARGPIAGAKGSSSTSPATASAASRRAISIGFQSFRMREFVAIGAPSRSRAFREQWIARATGIADALGLCLPRRGGERSVLRPRRRAGRQAPGRSRR